LAKYESYLYGCLSTQVNTRPNSTNKHYEQIKYSTFNKTHLFDYTRKDLQKLKHMLCNTEYYHTIHRKRWIGNNKIY
jgi:hypothetical protein